MCGIAAIITTTKSPATDGTPTLFGNLAEMTAQMKDRGPDGSGIFVGAGVGLAMTRLAIVGGDTGTQPIWNEDRTVVVVCNGEIYNYKALRNMLEQCNHVFSTESDIEVIVHLYEQYGEGFLNRIEGIFALALWDEATQTLLVARDKFGVKPLYYRKIQNQWVFCTQMKALLGDEDGDLAHIDAMGFRAYHQLRFCPGGQTLVKGVHKLVPASFGTIHAGNFVLKNYWAPNRPSGKLRAVPKRELTDTLRKRLIAAVSSQATNEVQTGLLLSGGLDSAGILGIHRLVFGEVPPCYTISFQAPKSGAEVREYDEIRPAADIAGIFHAHHIHETIDAQQAWEALPSIISALDEPIADPTAIPLWFAIRLAKSHGSKVVFSGEGIDEAFNGYEVSRQVGWLKTLGMMPKGMRQGLWSLAKKYGWRGTQLLERSLNHPATWYRGVGGVFGDDELRRLLRNPSHLADIDNIPLESHTRLIMDPVRETSLLTQLTHFDLFAWLPENTLVKSDKISMAQSVELRVPYLDSAIVEFALDLEDRHKLKSGVGKRIVRDAFVGILPNQTIYGRKNGFPIPLTAWMFGEWHADVRHELLKPGAFSREIYHPMEIERLLNTTGNGRHRAARLLWTMLTLELWHGQVYNRRSASVGTQMSVGREPSLTTI